MRYLNEEHIRSMGLQWKSVIASVECAVELIGKSTYVQPLKPYLRFNDLKNRIIAMPAYVGDPFGVAGIKWIASFPDNIVREKPRAHSVTILNDECTGEPISIINTALISGIRTAAVTGFMIKKYLEEIHTKDQTYNIGIIGFGPIGQLHLDMIMTAFGDMINKIFLFDLRKIDDKYLQDLPYHNKIIITDNWMQLFNSVDILATCTVSRSRYIDLPPKKGALYLNVSLRDFEVAFIQQTDLVIVDDWIEVCRENTDMERAHKEIGLNKPQVKEFADFAGNNILKGIKGKSIMFNPMGMAVFDIAVAKYYYDLSRNVKIGIDLD